MKYEKVKKKYSLNNSYFKSVMYSNSAPKKPIEVIQYFEQHKELPFTGADSEYWVYDTFVEYQKRAGVYNSQFFTPPKTAYRIAELADTYFGNDNFVLDACCGFGALSYELRKLGFKVLGFDRDYNIHKAYEFLTKSSCDNLAFDGWTVKCSNIVSNPPYEIPECTKFLEWLYEILEFNGSAVLLLPKGFMDKERPKATADIVRKFSIRHREDMKEPFARTGIRAEIVVVKKLVL